MKRIVLFLLPIIAVISLADASFAEKKVSINGETARQIVKITPHNLVTAGYQGRFINDGIPSGGRFLTAIRSRRIKAVDLVQTAIARGRLPETALNDQSYLRHVRSILANLDRN